jgi:hypothetical protein
LTSPADLLSIENPIKLLIGDQFSLRTMEDGVRIVTYNMFGEKAILVYLSQKNWHHFAFCSKSEKLVKAATQYLSMNTPSQVITFAVL